MKSYFVDKLNFYLNDSALLILLITAVILIIRKTDALINPQFWAEDGFVFFLQQYEIGSAALTQAYAGYLLLVPRLIALVADLVFPYSLIPAVYNYLSLLITLIVVLSIFSPRFHVNHKSLLALAIVLVPHYENEIFLNITNLQWILSVMLIVVLLKANPSRLYGSIVSQYIGDLAIIVVCGLTGPFIVLLMPFYGWKWINEKNSYNSIVLTAVVFTSLVQLSFIISDPMHGKMTIINPEIYTAIIGQKFFGSLFLGHKISYEINHYFLTFLFIVSCFWFIFFAYQKKYRFPFYCINIGLVFLLATLYKFRGNPEVLIPPENGPRYFYIPYVMLTWSLIFLLKNNNKQKKPIIIVLTFIFISSLTSHFRSKPFVDYQWSLYSQSIGKQNVVIPINPKGWHIPIKATVSAN
jgi:hypothetical protein